MTSQETKITSLYKLNDAAFKTIFRSVEARSFISSFLSEVTGISKESFLNAYFVGGELTKKVIEEKGKIADIIIHLDTLRVVIVEMNRQKNDYTFQKNFEYQASLMTEYTDIGKRNYHKVILVNINNFNRFQVKDPIQEFRLRDQHGNIDYEIDLTIYAG